VKQLHILVGPPGSGKSLHSTVYVAKGYTRINQDEQGREGHNKLFKESLSDGKNIIVDRMNFSKEQRAKYIKPAKELGYEVTITVLHVPRQTCLDRMSKREGHPTISNIEQANSALNTFFSKYEKPTEDEGKIDNKGWSEHGEALVIDIDGTAANIEHRRKYVDRSLGKPNWKEFFSRMGDDTPNQWCKELYTTFKKLGDREAIFASGRPDDYYNVTYDWLLEHYDYSPKLFMRTRNDFRQDYIAKEIILDFELKTRWNDLLFIDDRTQVVKMYRDRGYTVLQCDFGDF